MRTEEGRRDSCWYSRATVERQSREVLEVLASMYCGSRLAKNKQCSVAVPLLYLTCPGFRWDCCPGDSFGLRRWMLIFARQLRRQP